jgi:hypothetical protein
LPEDELSASRGACRLTRAPSASISAACARALSVIDTPPSIRAISSTLAPASSGKTWVRVLLPSVSFETCR